jgi:hypothetical protein
MFVAFHADVYFSLGGEVLLYFYCVSGSHRNCKFDLNSNWSRI